MQSQDRALYYCASRGKNYKYVMKVDRKSENPMLLSLDQKGYIKKNHYTII